MSGWGWRLALPLALILTACGGDSGSGPTPPAPPPPPPGGGGIASLTIQGAPGELSVGATAQLSVVSRDDAGAIVSNPALSWSSTSSAVAIVGPTGRIQAVSVGQAVIRVSGGGRTDEVPLSITMPNAVAIALFPATVPLAPGGSLQLSASVLGPNGAIPGVAVTYSSSSDAVATVDATGRVTAVAEGQASITARYGTIAQVTGVTVSTVSQNLRLAYADIIQVAQTETGSVPLVAGKASAIRLYPVATGGVAAGVPLDVRLVRNGTTIFSRRVSTGTIPGTFNRIADGAAVIVPVPDGLTLDGATIEATLDPEDASAEADEWDNDFPLFRDVGVPLVTVTLPQLKVRLIAFAPAGQPLPQITGALVQQVEEFLGALYPTVGVSVEIGNGFRTTHASWDSDAGVSDALNQLAIRRTEDGSPAYYYGVTAAAPINGSAGWGRLFGTVSMGYPDAETIGHEVGHNFGLAHPSGCGNGTPGAPGAVIGVPGYDPRTQQEVPSTAVSVMSYCPGYTWIQPTSYLSILNQRRTAATLQAGALASAPSSSVGVAVTGTISASGRVAVRTARASVSPRATTPPAGAVRVRFLGANGAELFDWQLASVASGDEHGHGVGARGFAGVIPVPSHIALLVRAVAVDAGTGEARMPLRVGQE